jgi:hypothetical protein
MVKRSSYPGVLLVAVIAACVTACLSSAGLSAWADALPDSAATRAASYCAHRLDDTMIALGVNRPMQVIQLHVRKVEAAKF